MTMIKVFDKIFCSRRRTFNPIIIQMEPIKLTYIYFCRCSSFRTSCAYRTHIVHWVLCKSIPLYTNYMHCLKGIPFWVSFYFFFVFFLCVCRIRHWNRNNETELTWVWVMFSRRVAGAIRLQSPLAFTQDAISWWIMLLVFDLSIVYIVFLLSIGTYIYCVATCGLNSQKPYQLLCCSSIIPH